jgi:signal transduction histidine kinase
MGAHPYDGIAAAVFPPGGRCPGLGAADALADAACWLCQAAVAASGLLVFLFFMRRRPPRGCAPKPGGGTGGQSRARDPAPPEAGQEQRPAADPLRDGPESYRFLVANIRDYAIILLDPRGRITSWNPGADQAELQSLAEALEGQVQEQAQALRARLGVLGGDITERRQADLALLQSQKLESLGVLAGGIAHDFNNLLGAMRGNVELAMTETSLERALPFLETLQGLMANGAGLLRQILAYAGPGQTSTRILDLNQLVEEMTHLLGSSISKKARVRLDLHPQLPPMEADPAQIQQVIMNLVINAAEAIGEQNGVITVSTRPDELAPASAERLVDGQPIRPGPHVRLEVADTGIGMTPEVLKRIYDPFFTTKFAGRGLGLAAIHGIVRGHHGCIQVASQPGRGSTFTLRFPAAPGQPGPPAPEPEPPPLGPPAPAGRAGGTVLVVDDEDAMRSVVVDALDRAGLATLEARDGVEALDLYQYHRDAIRLVILDLSMPNLDGEEACREFRRRGGRMPIVLTSGFDEAEALDRLRGLEVAGFIQKPFGLGALVELVLRLLPAEA